MTPPKPIETQIDSFIQNDIDFYFESKQREPEQMELIEDDFGDA